jgi:uncharacterized protein (TIGR02271 family)
MTDAHEETPPVIVPVIEEKLTAEKRVIGTGSVRVQKHVEKELKRVTGALLRETIDVQRVPINRVVEVAPATRVIGNTTIIPVVEEELVVTKRLVLKEEIHLTKKRTRENITRQVSLEKETAEVVRLDAQGRVTKGTAEKSGEFKVGRRPSILGKDT